MKIARAFLSTLPVILLCAVTAAAAPAKLIGSTGSLTAGNTFVEWGENAVTLPAGTFTNVGPKLTIKCTKSTGCPVLLHFAVTLNSTSKNVFTLIAVVDGQPANPQSFATSVAANGFADGIYSGSISVAKGSHTVRYQVEGESAGTVPIYNEETQVVQ